MTESEELGRAADHAAPLLLPSLEGMPSFRMMQGEEVRFTCCNESGDVKQRRVRPIGLRFGGLIGTDRAGWVLVAYDLELGVVRAFPLERIQTDDKEGAAQ